MIKENEFCLGLTEHPEIVNALKTSPIQKIVKPYWQCILVSYIRNVPHIPPKEIFNILPEPVLLYLENNDIIGFYFDRNCRSVITWYDVRDGIEYWNDFYNRDNSLVYYMQHDDMDYAHKDNWKHIIGKKLINISVLEYDEGRIRHKKYSFQRALILESETGNMVLSYMLGELFQLTTKEKMPEYIWDVSTITEL